MSEDSVFVDGVDSDVEEQIEETQETSEEQSTEGENSQQINNTEVEEKAETAEEPQLTEKGTRLDPNPMSAVYQQLANERRARKQLEDAIQNPQVLKEFLSKVEQPKQEEEFDFSADKLQTAEDVVKALNVLKSSFDKRTQSYEGVIKELEQKVTGLSEGRQIEQISNTIESDISRVRETYPELNPKSPSYNPDLEKEITTLYSELDYDQESKRYMGKVSLSKLVERIMGATSKAKQQGSKEAQTIIKDKSLARVTTSSKQSSSSSSEPEDAGAAIAQRIKNAFK